MSQKSIDLLKRDPFSASIQKEVVPNKTKDFPYNCPSKPIHEPKSIFSSEHIDQLCRKHNIGFHKQYQN